MMKYPFAGANSQCPESCVIHTTRPRAPNRLLMGDKRETVAWICRHGAGAGNKDHAAFTRCMSYGQGLCNDFVYE